MSTNSINRETDAYIIGRGESRREHYHLHSDAVNGIKGVKDGEKWVRESGDKFRSVESLKPRSEDLDKLYDKNFVTGYNEALKTADKSAARVSMLKLTGGAGVGLLIGVGAMALYNRTSTHPTSQAMA